jgi:capsular polysaccharide biosynthesis protein
MNLRELARAFLQNWWILLAVVLITTGTATAFSYNSDPVYEASATFVANPSMRLSSADDVLYSLDTLASRSTLVNTFCEILTSRAILRQAGAGLELGNDLLARFINGSENASVECVIMPESSVIRLILQGPSPNLTSDLTNAIGAEGIRYIGGLQEVYELRVLDSAIPDSDPVAPNHVFDIGFGLAVGLIGGASIAALRFGLQNRPDLLKTMVELRRDEDSTETTYRGD